MTAGQRPRGAGEPFDLQRRVVSHMVSQSWSSVPHVSYLYEPDVTDFLDAYEKLRARFAAEDARLTLNTLLLRVVAEGLKAAPSLNAQISYNHRKSQGALHVRPDISIAVPWTLPDGRMITPVVTDVGAISLRELCASMAELERKIASTDIDELLYRAGRANTLEELRRLHVFALRRLLARSGGRGRLRGSRRRVYYGIPEKDRLTEDNLVSGTVTVSNIGSLYKAQRGCFGILEIIPPQVFAAGLSAVQEMPGVYAQNGEKRVGVRKILPMCLVFDHRAADFSALVPFLRRLDEIFANPSELARW